MKVRLGRLRHRITLQSKTTTRTDTGAVEYTWTNQGTVWGAIEPLSGKEFLALSQTKNETTVRLVIRYKAGLNTNWRAVSGGKAYSILSIINHDERDNMMTLMCSEGVYEN